MYKSKQQPKKNPNQKLKKKKKKPFLHKEACKIIKLNISLLNSYQAKTERISFV